MKSVYLILVVLILTLSGCTNNTTQQRSVELYSEEYNKRISSAKIISEKVYAIIKNESQISSNDSILLLSKRFKNGILRSRVYHSYSSTGINERDPMMILDDNSIFFTPYDYKSLCYISRAAFDSLGQLRFQKDSIDEKRSYEYDHRSGRISDNVIELGNDKEELYRLNIKYYNKSRKDSLIEQEYGFKGGFISAVKFFDWLDDSTFKMKSFLIRSMKDLDDFKKGKIGIKSELVLS